jgi:hypothetical protein
MEAKTMFSLRVGNPGEKFPALHALGIKRLVPQSPTMAIAALDRPNMTAPPVKARIETKKASIRARKALPARTVRRSRVFRSASSVLATVMATKSRPRMAADAPELAMKKFS